MTVITAVNGPVTIGDNNHIQVGARIESATLGNANLIEPNAVVSAGCTVGNGCVVGALVKLAQNTELRACTVVYGAQNTTTALERPEDEIVEERTKAVTQQSDLLHREFLKIQSIQVRESTVE
eukprot:SAG22_NODE_247_length_13918_cov_7.885375_4_plen_123_part_00